MSLQPGTRLGPNDVAALKMVVESGPVTRGGLSLVRPIVLTELQAAPMSSRR